jgi:hypothetical protein
MARPDTPPAQPRPNTGTRSTSAAKAHAAGHPRLEAGRGDAGRGHGDDGVDVARLAAGVGERAARRIDEESLRALEVGGVALRPAEIVRYQSIGFTVWRVRMPAVSNTGAMRSKAA